MPWKLALSLAITVIEVLVSTAGKRGERLLFIRHS